MHRTDPARKPEHLSPRCWLIGLTLRPEEETCRCQPLQLSRARAPCGIVLMGIAVLSPAAANPSLRRARSRHCRRSRPRHAQTDHATTGTQRSAPDDGAVEGALEAASAG